MFIILFMTLEFLVTFEIHLKLFQKQYRVSFKNFKIFKNSNIFIGQSTQRGGWEGDRT